MGIPLASEPGTDFWQCSKEISGWHSVKSAYKLSQMINGRWQEDVNAGFQRALWKLKVPPKVRNLLWRASIGCLPTHVQLRLKHVEVDSIFPLCQGAPETITHILVSYPFAQRCWEETRNDLVWSQKHLSVEQVVVLAKSNLNQWLQAQEKQVLLPSLSLLAGDGGVCWTKPQFGFVKVNVDASLFLHDNHYGFSCVARDREGKLFRSFCLL
ncbi:uncharacterized protein LOC133795082 [Humulus lupulus]|uniref:uncharacterized protein LOC133795082 n=1 Tax=Humulus lupulus TaxID=3486 RepID=UPI002B408BD3|nr:uncharacterized protein LOC133795082 [Humulus lupulus]